MQAKLFIALMYPSDYDYSIILETLEKRFGKISSRSDEFDFNFTEYYKKEFGVNLKKRFFLFDSIDEEDLYEIKLLTNKLEKELIKDQKRTINIDPGYITKTKVVIASNKDRPHRVCIGPEVYGDMNFMFTKDDIIKLKWTFPDYEQNKGFFINNRR